MNCNPVITTTCNVATCTEAVVCLRPLPMTIEPIRFRRLFVRNFRDGEYKKKASRYIQKRNVIAAGDTNLENDITRRNIDCLRYGDALLSLIKHGRLVSAAIDLSRS